MEPFEEVVGRHGPVVWRVCRALLAPADADDAWSETFLSALRAYPDLRPGSDVRAWLVTIAHRKAIDQIRRAGRAPSPVGDPPERASAEGIPEPPDEALRAALAALAPKQRAAVVLHHVAGLPYAEVGPLIESSEAAARRNAADGIAHLRATYPKGTRP
ncbi:MAG TPA: RNA polymerase sigma factor [Acidimicrobiales bacterium]|nr:RNA polymerase sigma factor [Acidimicrobiales bacterium]